MVSRKSRKVTPRSSERIRNETKTTHPAGNLYGRNMGETKETWEYERKKKRKSSLACGPRTEPIILIYHRPFWNEYGMYRRLSPIRKYLSGVHIEGGEKVIHAVVQGDEKTPAVCIKHANAVGSWICSWHRENEFAVGGRSGALYAKGVGERAFDGVSASNRRM